MAQQLHVAFVQVLQLPPAQPRAAEPVLPEPVSQWAPRLRSVLPREAEPEWALVSRQVPLSQQVLLPAAAPEWAPAWAQSTGWATELPGAERAFQ